MLNVRLLKFLPLPLPPPPYPPLLPVFSPPRHLLLVFLPPWATSNLPSSTICRLFPAIFRHFPTIYLHSPPFPRPFRPRLPATSAAASALTSPSAAVASNTFS